MLICVYLLITGRLGGWQFGFALVASMFIVIGIHNLDLIQNITVKAPGGTEAVMQIRQLRDEVYAIVDELKKVAAGVATYPNATIAT